MRHLQWKTKLNEWKLWCAECFYCILWVPWFPGIQSVEDTINKHMYASIFSDRVGLYIQIVFPEDDDIYQKNDVRYYTARSVRTWFQEP